MKVKKLIVFGMTMMAILVSCERHPSFSSSEEALQGCKQQLELLKQKQDASIEDLSSLTSTWLEVRDSAYSSFGRDSSLNLKSPMAVAYFMVSDSIRAEITRLAFVKPRSLREVMYFKLNTAMQRKVLEKKLGLHILYASKQNYGKLLKAAAYSTPVDGSMFIIHMGSEQYGVIDSLTVHFYDSDETMLLGIQHVLRDVTRVPAEVLEYQKMDEILSFFF